MDAFMSKHTKKVHVCNEILCANTVAMRKKTFSKIYAADRSANL